MNGLRRSIANADFACAAWSKFSPPFIDPAQDADDAQNVPLGYYKTHSTFLKRPSIQITVFLRPLIHHHHHFLSVCLSVCPQIKMCSLLYPSVAVSFWLIIIFNHHTTSGSVAKSLNSYGKFPKPRFHIRCRRITGGRRRQGYGKCCQKHHHIHESTLIMKFP